jgi:hypothetical protein
MLNLEALNLCSSDQSMYCHLSEYSSDGSGIIL